jgi:hypothetical protein
LFRASAALEQLSASGKPVTFRAVATQGAVSPAWLYRQPDLRRTIESQRARSAAPLPTEARRSVSSQESIIATLRLRIQELEARNRELLKQVEVLYGKLAASH